MRRFVLPVATLIAIVAAPCLAQAPRATAMYALATPVTATTVTLSNSPFTLVAEAARLSPAESRAFRASQLGQQRVRTASARVGSQLAQRFADAGLPYPTDVLFRVFKTERIFEVWG